MKAGSIIKMTELEDYEKADLYTYQWLIGKLIYLACGIKPDISFVVKQLNRHNTNPRKDHLWAAKKIVRYLYRIMKMGLIYGWELNNQMLRDLLPIGLIGFVDSSFTGDPEDWKLVMDYYFFLNRAFVS